MTASGAFVSPYAQNLCKNYIKWHLVFNLAVPFTAGNNATWVQQLHKIVFSSNQYQVNNSKKLAGELKKRLMYSLVWQIIFSYMYLNGWANNESLRFVEHLTPERRPDCCAHCIILLIWTMKPNSCLTTHPTLQPEIEAM